MCSQQGSTLPIFPPSMYPCWFMCKKIYIHLHIYIYMVPPMCLPFPCQATRLQARSASWCSGFVRAHEWLYGLSSLSRVGEGLAQFLQNPKIHKSSIFLEMVKRSLDFWIFEFLDFWIFGFTCDSKKPKNQESKNPKLLLPSPHYIGFLDF